MYNGHTKMEKPRLDRGYEGSKTQQKGPKMGLGSMQVKAPLKGHEEDYSTHARQTPNMEKKTLNRVHASHKTHK